MNNSHLSDLLTMTGGKPALMRTRFMRRRLVRPLPSRKGWMNLDRSEWDRGQTKQRYNLSICFSWL